MKIKASDFSGAIPSLNDAIQKNPEDPLGYLYRGHCFRETDNNERAMEDFGKVIELDPDNIMVYNERGIAYALVKDYEKAMEDFNKALQTDPLNDLAICNKGFVYLEQGRYEEAIREFNASLEINPDNHRAISNKAIAHQKMFEASETPRGIEDSPGAAFYYEGINYAQQRNYDQAIEQFTKAIEADPEFAVAYHDRAVAYYNKGELEKAWKDVEKGLELGGKIHPGLLEEYNRRNK